MKDYEREICSEQAFTTAAVSENTWDVDAADKNLGNAVIYAHLRVNVSFTGAASGVRIHVVDSAAEALTGDRAISTFTSTACSDDAVIPATDLTAGTHLIVALPPGIKNKQYLGLAVVPVSEALATGNITAWFSEVAGEVDLQ
jgi:hypothetical protein